MPHHLLTAHADVATDAPARYAKQLLAHLGRKLEFTTHGATSTARIGDATAEVTIGDGVLTLRATSADEQGLATVEDVLGRHLESFGQRAGLVVTWVRTPTVDAEEPA
ncbi:DUF2218 domain-containing protein [Knoellia aerolata]|uniref:DUF2218 domain-containing protein n=1 Tax=Knoellia aerolata DSM 18566 TaxID=1385519 RepID=A0A0A0K0K8_9MICO|nr:DUF2218 domain-containing protein [Knoellia aerolata]KGN41326.1 hypothetical protein N801_07860 [Knoellia aerolata DSM 18566]